MRTDKLRKYILPNIPYLFVLWACLKVGTAYRLATGAGFGEKLLGTIQTIGPAFADFAPGLDPFERSTARPVGGRKRTSSPLPIPSLKTT